LESPIHRRSAAPVQVLAQPYRSLRHLARFILIGVYSGTRAGAIASASPTAAIGRPFVDLERGVYYRRAQGKQETKNRRPPMLIPPRLLAHLRRWKERKIIAWHFVESNGEGASSVKTAFKHAVTLAKLGPGVSPHERALVFCGLRCGNTARRQSAGDPAWPPYNRQADSGRLPCGSRPSKARNASFNLL
jgi:hypothetical protein